MKDTQISMRVSHVDINYIKKLGYGLTEVWELGVEYLKEQEPDLLKEKIEFHKKALEYYKKRIQNICCLE